MAAPTYSTPSIHILLLIFYKVSSSAFYFLVVISRLISISLQKIVYMVGQKVYILNESLQPKMLGD